MRSGTRSTVDYISRLSAERAEPKTFIDAALLLLLLMDFDSQGQAHVPYLSDHIPDAFICPNCTQEFSNGDDIIHHLAIEGSCGRWLVETLPSIGQTPSTAAGIDQNEDLDTTHDMEGWHVSFSFIPVLT